MGPGGREAEHQGVTPHGQDGGFPACLMLARGKVGRSALYYLHAESKQIGRSLDIKNLALLSSRGNFY